MPTMTKEIIEAAIVGFEAQKRQIDEQLTELRALLTPAANVPAPTAGRRRRGRMSAAGRRAIADAQRKRWAVKRGESPAPRAPKRRKRKLSPEGREAIVAALKKRWAAKKASSGAVTAKKN